MATYHNLNDAFADLNRMLEQVQKNSYKIETEMFNKYIPDINEVTPIDTGRLRRYPHTQGGSLRSHTLVWSPTENKFGNIQRPYVGYIYGKSNINFQNPRAISDWDMGTAIKNNDEYIEAFNDILLKYIK